MWFFIGTARGSCKDFLGHFLLSAHVGLCTGSKGERSFPDTLRVEGTVDSCSSRADRIQEPE